MSKARKVLLMFVIGTQTVSADIVLYSRGAAPGLLGDRSAQDAACAGFDNKPSGYSHYQSFISFSADDQLQNAPSYQGSPYLGPPANARIVGPTPDAVIIAESWENLWKADDEGKNALMASLGAAGVIPDKSLWWSGTSPDGAADIHHNCASWSMTTGFALVGDSQAIDSNWVGYAVDKCASPSVFAVCMAWGQVGSK